MDYLTPVIAAGKCSVATGKTVGIAECGVNVTGLGASRAKHPRRPSVNQSRIGYFAL